MGFASEQAKKDFFHIDECGDFVDEVGWTKTEHRRLVTRLQRRFFEVEGETPEDIAKSAPRFFREMEAEAYFGPPQWDDL